MKKDKPHIDALINALMDGNGRVRSCKMANIDHQTLLNWERDDSEFSDRIKEAEIQGNVKLKDLQKRKILEDKSWQSGAWWLERNYPEEFRNRQEVKHEGPVQINITKDESKL